MQFRFATLLFLLLCFCAVVSFAQAGDDAIARAAIAGGSPDAGARAPIVATSVKSGSPNTLVFDAQTGVVVSGGFNMSLSSKAGNSSPQVGNDDGFDIGERRPNVPTIAGLDTLATFDGAFHAQAGPNSSITKLFRWTMVGNDPRQGGTTEIPFSAVTVDLQLLNADGSVFMVVPFAPFQTLTLESPNFEPLDYRSGHRIEYADAVHRAQFFHIMRDQWHTLLIPAVQDHVTITVPRFVNVQLSNGNIIQARSYFTGHAADGQTFVLMLNLLFNFFFDNLVVNEINTGNFTTDAINATLFPNTYLFSLNVNNPNTPGGCCVLGFHTYFFDPSATPQPRWITQYASWISPGIFGGGFQDVTALSHETAEIFGDPFLDNVTPSWQFPGEPPTAKVCQGNLEEGDPIEVLANATTTITVKEGGFNFTYHPQNIPLLQWFEMGAKSDAIDGAFSFPDETLLPHSALPCPQ
ncbi:MAG TPA: hypothetical protein VKW06_20445 [Candidatus Angelobacter sp.]|nr:hypothetical protein [Candidatus Angelobacter sp.]